MMLVVPRRPPTLSVISSYAGRQKKCSTLFVCIHVKYSILQHAVLTSARRVRKDSIDQLQFSNLCIPTVVRCSYPLFHLVQLEEHYTPTLENVCSFLFRIYINRKLYDSISTWK